MNAPVSSAAAAVTILNVEPGTNRPALARSRSGAAGVHAPRIASIWPKWPSTRFGLYDGDEARTSTRPVFGSMATAAPHLSARPAIAARWPSRSSVVTTSFPCRGIPRILSRVVSITVLRFAFEAVRKSFMDFSMPVRARVIVE